MRAWWGPSWESLLAVSISEMLVAPQHVVHSEFYARLDAVADTAGHTVYAALCTEVLAMIHQDLTGALDTKHPWWILPIFPGVVALVAAQAARSAVLHHPPREIWQGAAGLAGDSAAPGHVAAEGQVPGPRLCLGNAHPLDCAAALRRLLYAVAHVSRRTVRMGACSRGLRVLHIQAAAGARNLSVAVLCCGFACAHHKGDAFPAPTASLSVLVLV